MLKISVGSRSDKVKKSPSACVRHGWHRWGCQGMLPALWGFLGAWHWDRRAVPLLVALPRLPAVPAAPGLEVSPKNIRAPTRRSACGSPRGSLEVLPFKGQAKLVTCYSLSRGFEYSRPLASFQMDNYIELTQISSADSIVNYFLALSCQCCI